MPVESSKHGQTYACLICLIFYLESLSLELFQTVPSFPLVLVQGTICAERGLVAQPVSAEHEIINIFGVTASHAASHTFAVMPCVALPQGVRKEPRQQQSQYVTVSHSKSDSEILTDWGKVGKVLYNRADIQDFAVPSCPHPHAVDMFGLLQTLPER